MLRAMLRHALPLSLLALAPLVVAALSFSHEARDERIDLSRSMVTGTAELTRYAIDDRYRDVIALARERGRDFLAGRTPAFDDAPYGAAILTMAVYDADGRRSAVLPTDPGAPTTPDTPATLGDPRALRDLVWGRVDEVRDPGLHAFVPVAIALGEAHLAWFALALDGFEDLLTPPSEALIGAGLHVGIAQRSGAQITVAQHLRPPDDYATAATDDVVVIESSERLPIDVVAIGPGAQGGSRVVARTLIIGGIALGLAIAVAFVLARRERRRPR